MAAIGVLPEQLTQEVLISYPVEIERLDIYNQFLLPAGEADTAIDCVRAFIELARQPPAPMAHGAQGEAPSISPALHGPTNVPKPLGMAE